MKKSAAKKEQEETNFFQKETFLFDVFWICLCYFCEILFFCMVFCVNYWFLVKFVLIYIKKYFWIFFDVFGKLSDKLKIDL